MNGMHTQNLLFLHSLHIQSMMWNTKERDNKKHTKTVLHIFLLFLFQNKMHQKENGKCLWFIIYLQEYTSERVTSGNVQKQAKLCPKNGT